jgi:ribosomal protein L19E
MKKDRGKEQDEQDKKDKRRRGGDGGHNARHNKHRNDVTSIPACRKSLCAEKNDRYFDLKHLKTYIHLNISYIFL